MLKKLFADVKKSKTGYKNRTRMLLVFCIMALLFAALTLRLGWHMIIKGSDYALKAGKQQTSDSVVTAVRGDILDSTGSQLAISAITNTVWVRPASVRNNGKTDQEIEANALLEAKKISEILDLDEESVLGTITSEKNLVRLAKNVDDDKAETLRKEDLKGIEIVQDVRRYYPLGSFASQVLGLTNDDGDGMTGLELYYNRYLSGINGRWITSKDEKKNSLVYGTNKYYNAEDGYTLVTTIDQAIQYIVEEKVAKYLEIDKADRVAAIVMDPQTGDILAMAQSDEFDPNSPREPAAGDEEKFAEMTDTEKVAYWNKLWRSYCISDTYEPGSTFKLITTSIALDAGVTYMGDTFKCNGFLNVADRKIRCWNYPKAHGNESLPKAVANSCNVAMMYLVSRMGRDTFYDGIESFGLTEKTGIDFPGEASNQVYSRSAMGIVEMSTMSFGQGIALTPLSMVTAVSAIANGGYLLQPHLIKEIRDSKGNVVESYGRTVKSIAISSQTAAEVREIMEFVVNNGGGGKARVPGYRIGGKTGTAQKPSETGGYSDYVIGSFIGAAPIEDPKMVILVLVDSPRTADTHGSNVAAPCFKEIAQDVLQYMNIEPKYTEEELKKMKSTVTKVPDLTGEGYENISGILGAQELDYVLSPALEGDPNVEIVVTDQYPKPGTEVTKNSTVTIYYEICEEENEPL